VYRKLKRYAFLRRKLIEKITRQHLFENGEEGQNNDNLRKIEKKFEGVQELQEKFNERIFSIISRTYSLATEKPVDIVRVMRIVKNEEVANKAAEKSIKEDKQKDIIIESDDDEDNNNQLLGSIFNGEQNAPKKKNIVVKSIPTSISL
jgi:hypothetical protein